MLPSTWIEQRSAALAFGMRADKKAGAVIGEREMVEAALVFANGKDWETAHGSGPMGADKITMIDSLTARQIAIVKELLQAEKRLLAEYRTDAGEAATQQREQELAKLQAQWGEHQRERERSRAWLRQVLQEVYADPDTAPARWRKAITDGATKIRAYVQFKFSEKDLTSSTVIDPGRAAAIFVAALFLDSSRPYGRDLCRCKLDGCGDYFLVYRPPTGRPRRDYCSAEHMDEAQRRTLSARVMKSKRKKAAARRPK